MEIRFQHRSLVFWTVPPSQGRNGRSLVTFRQCVHLTGGRERERERDLLIYIFIYSFIHLFIYLFNKIIYSFKTTKRVQCKNGMESWTLILAEALDPGSNPLLLMEVRPSSQHAKFLGAFLVLSHKGCGSKRTDCMQHSVVRRHVLSLLQS